MNNNPHTLPTTRREFLKFTSGGIGLLAFSSFAPSFLVKSVNAATPAPERDRSILVIVQLAGGNDGLNTVIPYEDAHYYKLRPTLGIAKEKVLRLSNTIGLHPGCAELNELFKDGKLGIIQNVGYPNPNHSHFRSTEIWETATDSDKFADTGWIGRYLDNTCHGSPTLDAAAGTNANVRKPAKEKSDADDAGANPDAIHVTSETPQSFLSAHPHSTFGLNPALFNRRDNGQNLAFLETLIATKSADAPTNASKAIAETVGHEDNDTYLKQTMMDAIVTEKHIQKVLGTYKPGATYPQSNFAQSLRNVAGLIAANLSTRVYFVSLGGFDTHANQANQHQNLMRALSEGMSAFQKDLEAHGLADQVATMTFSEFGRRPMENESKGTDHGTAAPLFVMGSKIKGGLHGTAPSLNLQRNQDMAFSTDFRQVYATMIEKWLGTPAQPVLGADFKPLAFL